MSFFDSDTILYIIVILVFAGFFLWNRSRTNKNRESRKNRNFRNRYNEKKKGRR